MIPKCCCNPAACHYVDDDFTRANETPVAAPWTKLTGTNWNLASNVLDAVAAADYKHTTAFPGASGDSRTAVVDFKLSTDGSVEVQTGKTDENNYFAAKLTYVSGDCAILTAFCYVAGVGGSCTPGPTVTACVQVWGLTTGAWYRLRVCLIPNTGSYGYETQDKVIAVISFPNDATRSPISCQTTAEGPSVGTLSGLKSTMAAQFDNFTASYYRDSPSGEHRTCPWCHTDCAISQDAFTTDEPCLWDVVSGSYSVSGGKMVLGATPSKIQHHIFHPGLKTTFKFTVDVDDDGTTRRFFQGNGYAVLDTSGGGHRLRLYNNDDVLLDTDTDAIATGGPTLSVEMCYSRGVLSCTVAGGSVNLCVDTSIEETDEGYWASLGGSNGATFDNFVLSKTYDATAPADSCPDCDACPTTCNDCCTSPDPAGSYIVDLGVGGWTSRTCGPLEVSADSYCDSCEEAAGEFEVVAYAECGWFFTGDYNCHVESVSIGGNGCCADALCYDWRLQIFLALVKDGTGCRWRVNVGVGPRIVTGDGNCSCAYWDSGSSHSSGHAIGATYYSAYLTGTDQCNTMPVTLTKDSETGDFPCTGTLPATITLESAS